MSWTDDRVEQLKKLWADGLSASQIASKLGEVTRNAVIGKVHRLGLAGRATTSRVRTARPRSNIALFPARSSQVQYRTFGNAALKPAVQPQERKIASVVPLRALPELQPAPEGLVTLPILKRPCAIGRLATRWRKASISAAAANPPVPPIASTTRQSPIIPPRSAGAPASARLRAGGASSVCSASALAVPRRLAGASP